MKALVALYQSTAREFLRDKMAILFTMLLPLAMAGFFGLIFSQEQSFHMNMGLVVEDQSPAATQIAAIFTRPELAGSVGVSNGSREELTQAMKDGRVALVVVLPKGLSENLGTKRSTPVEVLWDKSQQSVAAPAVNMVRQLLQETNLQLMGGTPLLAMQETVIENRRIPTAQLYVPGMLAISILWLGVFGVAPPLVQLRETKVLRRLGATPLSRTTLLGAQIGWRLTTGLIQAAIMIGFGIVVFKMQVVGNWFLLLAAVLLGTMVLVSLGFLLAGIARTNEAVVGLGQLVQFPMMFLSGLLFPMDMLPSFLGPVVNAMPLTYLGDALKQIMLGATPLFPLWVDFAVLGGCLVLFSGLAVRFFRWE